MQYTSGIYKIISCIQMRNEYIHNQSSSTSCLYANRVLSHWFDVLIGIGANWFLNRAKNQHHLFRSQFKSKENQPNFLQRNTKSTFRISRRKPKITLEFPVQSSSKCKTYGLKIRFLHGFNFSQTLLGWHWILDYHWPRWLSEGGKFRVCKPSHFLGRNGGCGPIVFIFALLGLANCADWSDLIHLGTETRYGVRIDIWLIIYQVCYLSSCLNGGLSPKLRELGQNG